MALRLTDEGTERGGDDREGLKEARRAVGAARSRLEELADRLRELRGRLGDGGPGEGGSKDIRSPEISSAGAGSVDQARSADRAGSADRDRSQGRSAVGSVTGFRGPS